jgi:uncharacterized protein (TIGR03086 family)
MAGTVEESAGTFELIDGALDRFGAKVRAVPVDRWTAPTPCTEWSVRDLVNHVVGEHLWAPPLLGGATIADVGDRYDGDLLGGDPVAAWERAQEVSRAAWRSTSPDFTVHLSFGDVPALEYGEQMLLDLVVHGWDLARGAGLDEMIDPPAAEHVLAYLEPVAKGWHDAGVFADAVDVEFGGTAGQLLGLTGRRP